MGEPKELIKHCIQLPHDCGYQTAVSLLEKLMRILKDTIIRPKCERISDSQQWNAIDTPEMYMLIAKLPGGLMDRWNKKVQVIRKKHLCEPDLQDLMKFVEEETVLMNDPLFSREALHQYTKHPKNLPI